MFGPWRESDDDVRGLWAGSAALGTPRVRGRVCQRRNRELRGGWLTDGAREALAHAGARSGNLGSPSAHMQSLCLRLGREEGQGEGGLQSWSRREEAIPGPPLSRAGDQGADTGGRGSPGPPRFMRQRSGSLQLCFIKAPSTHRSSSRLIPPPVLGRRGEGREEQVRYLRGRSGPERRRR